MEQQTKTYEIMFLVPAGQASMEASCEPIRQILDRYGAEIILCEPWDDRKLAYRIREHKRGLYVLCYCRVAPERVAEIEHDCNLSEDIIRIQILRREDLTEQQAREEFTATRGVEKSLSDRDTGDDDGSEKGGGDGDKDSADDEAGGDTGGKDASDDKAGDENASKDDAGGKDSSDDEAGDENASKDDAGDKDSSDDEAGTEAGDDAGDKDSADDEAEGDAAAARDEQDSAAAESNEDEPAAADESDEKDNQ